MADHWSYYRSDQGVDPVRSYLATLSRADRSTVKARMNLARNEPGSAPRTACELFEVRASRGGRGHRVLFAREGDKVLLALFSGPKIAERVPRHQVEIARARLEDWRSRGNKTRKVTPTRKPTPTRTLGLGR